MNDLKNRKRYTNSLDIKLLSQLKDLSVVTKIPQSKLIDEAITDLLKKYIEIKKSIQEKLKKE